MLRFTCIVLFTAAVLVVGLLGFRGSRSEQPPLRLPGEYFSDMRLQGKYKPQAGSDFFADRRAQRQPPKNTVPWGNRSSERNPAFLADDAEDFARKELPVPIDRALLLRGRERFDIYCSVCHGSTGKGDGIVTEYGLNNPPSYHDERLRVMPPGEIFKTMTLGKGQMGPYGDKLERADRWAVVAYIRTLQRAFSATIADVPEAARKELER